MNKENDYWKGILVGFAVSTIVWCTLWAFVIGKIDKVHKQELDYIIEKHQTKQVVNFITYNGHRYMQFFLKLKQKT